MKYRLHLPISLPGQAREFHIRRSARDRYSFKDSLFSIQGHVLLANAGAARELAHRVNSKRDAARNPSRALAAADVFAMGLMDEVLHYLIGQYRETVGADVFGELQEHLQMRFPGRTYQETLLRFSELFPTVACYQGKELPEESLSRTVDSVSGSEIALEEMLVLRLDNENPAYSPGQELFDERDLDVESHYGEIVDEIDLFFRSKPKFGPENLTLTDLLRLPARLYPNSLQDQLRFMRENWSGLLGTYFDRLLRGLDLIAEENRVRFSGSGPATVMSFGGSPGDDESDTARFSPDRDWMPEVVLLAKSTLVWLDQLSRLYGRDIRTLDAIPDEELDAIASRGFAGLWLIGLWERSTASKRIKRSMGNPEAEASAYSIYDYDIASELGGWNAVENLRSRLWRRGVRLASDMVPNHVAIDGRWVYEHPEWFIQVDHPPFPAYSFNSENLSSRDGFSIQLEDHYYDKSDAAVVFRVWDGHAGRERFIYHGNDGTSMPWNDTAQVDYLNPEAREAVIQTILHVARNFPIIRFDAAMTLAKKHIRRLWFPAPGHGGDIASRSEHGLSDEDFNRAIPIEFWREVVDRVAQEAPDTLLLAEAFWMMEGYFVRTLGMHRVYNSAFMNMLKNEDNDKYRQTIKNTLEYDPQILKRFVNFMNNPDEETAVTQFGRDDKYFGVATLMVTMPGLPMFGHGQVEGFEEKYGMEYRHAYKNETPDQHLIERHEREIFPLIRRRHLFAESHNFRLYDFFDTNGSLNENVYAYSNRAGDERSIVFFNNSYYETAGWIQTSVPFVRSASDEDRLLETEHLGSGIGISNNYDSFLIFRELHSNLWYVRNCGEIHERGLYVQLRGYESQIFLDMREVNDSAHAHYARLADELSGAGVPDLDASLRRLLLKPLHDAFTAIANSGRLRHMQKDIFPHTLGDSETASAFDWDSFVADYGSFLEIASRFSERSVRAAPAKRNVAKMAKALRKTAQATTKSGKAARALKAHFADQADDYSILLTLLLLLPVDDAMPGDPRETVDQIAQWLLVGEMKRLFEQMRPEGNMPENWELLVTVLLTHFRWAEPGEKLVDVVERLLADDRTRAFLGVHEWEGTVWFNRESFEQLTAWLFVVALWVEHLGPTKGLPARREKIFAAYHAISAAGEKSGFQIDGLLSETKKCDAGDAVS